MTVTKTKIMAGAAALLMTTMLAAAGLGTVQVQAQGTSYDKAFGDSVKAYLMDHPEVVMEALQEYQLNQQDIESRRTKQTIIDRQAELHDPQAPFAGNPDGTLKIVEFFDYNCGYCKRAIGDVQSIIENEADVKFIFREMPILNDSSRLAAQYALAAHKQGKYFDYHVALMNFRGQKTEEALKKIGADLGLDVEQLTKDSASVEIQEHLEKDIALSRDLGIRGTPAFIIGETMQPGYLPYTQMRQVIADERKAQAQ